MARPPRSLSTALAALAVLAGAAGCSRPDPNPPVRVTGHPSQAIPEVATTTTTSTSTTTTTMFYGPSS
jgi:hypothetical protein